jgi:DNA polymerase-3 subunit delta
MDAGASADEAVGAMRPPVFFKRKNAVVQAVRVWSAAAIVRAIAKLASTARDARLNAALGRDILGDALFTLARHAGGNRQGR